MGSTDASKSSATPGVPTSQQRSASENHSSWPYGPEIGADGDPRTDYTDLEIPPSDAAVTVPIPPPVSEGTRKATRPNGVNDYGDEVWILPSGSVSDIDFAQPAFEELGNRRELFRQGSQVVEIVEENDGEARLERIGASALRTRLELLGPLHIYRKRGLGFDLIRGRCSEETAKAILFSRANRLLPPIQLVVKCPIIVATADGGVEILTKGYHHPHGGTYVTRGRYVPKVPLDTAIRSIVRVFEDFEFLSPSDTLTAWGNVITIGLKLGGILTAPAPIQYAEASMVGSGKSYLQDCTAAFFGERPWVATQRQRGVGGLDETVAQGMAHGRMCIKIDNVDGELCSQYLASTLSHDKMPVRVPYRREIEVDVGRHVFFLNTNGAVISPDLQRRFSVVRLGKRPPTYRYCKYREGRILDHIRANQPYYLGCVYAVIREWVYQGMPTSKESRHSFADWACAIDWIIQHIFKAGMSPFDGYDSRGALMPAIPVPPGSELSGDDLFST